MRIEFDPAKREWTLRHRQLDFADAEALLTGLNFTYEDLRQFYGEPRFVTLGHLRGRLMVLVWTPRIRHGEAVHHIISMRRANAREKDRFANELRQA